MKQIETTKSGAFTEVDSPMEDGVILQEELMW